MITKAERRKYVLKTAQDARILEKIKALEKLRLSKRKKLLLKFCKSQLLDDWRTPLEKFVDKMRD